MIFDRENLIATIGCVLIFGMIYLASIKPVPLIPIGSRLFRSDRRIAGSVLGKRSAAPRRFRLVQFAIRRSGFFSILR